MWMYYVITLAFLIGGFIFLFRDSVEYIYHPTIWEYIVISFKSFLWSLLFGLIGICASFLIMIGGSIAVSVCAETVDIKSYEKPIYSLQDNIGTQGRFYLGRGSVDTGLSYFFVVEEERGEKIASSKASDTYLKRDGGKYVERYDIVFKNTFLRSHFVNMLDDSYYILHVPEDTIEIDNYRVDLQ